MYDDRNEGKIFILHLYKTRYHYNKRRVQYTYTGNVRKANIIKQKEQ